MSLLKTTMILNAVSCLCFGGLFAVFSAQVDAFIGNPIKLVTPIIGVILIVNGIHLLLATRRQTIIKLEIYYFILGDVAWVIASIILILLGIAITSTQGVWVAAIVAGMVGTFGLLQYLGLRSAKV